MPVNIEIDEDLIQRALLVTGLRSKHEVVEMALKHIIRPRAQQNIRKLRGKLKWVGDLAEMRGADGTAN